MVDVEEPQREARPELIGAYLASIREAKDLPLEQAARDTRIRIQLLREIERDDYSKFSHPSYARMFLMDYARYLGVPLATIRDLLPDRGECGVQGYQYLRCIPDVDEYVPLRRHPRRSLLPAFAGLVAVLAISVGGFKLWVTYRNLDRIGFGRTAPEHISVPAQTAAAPIESTAVESVAPAPAEAAEEVKLLAPPPQPAETSAMDIFSLQADPAGNPNQTPFLEKIPSLDSVEARIPLTPIGEPQVYAGSLPEEAPTVR